MGFDVVNNMVFNYGYEVSKGSFGDEVEKNVGNQAFRSGYSGEPSRSTGSDQARRDSGGI